MKILAIETSCDETAAAVLKNGRVLSNIVASQIEIHKKTGGVVPEVASRAHTEKILPVIEEALKKADTSLNNIDLIAVTSRPGLIGSLLVGVETAKTLAYAYGKPIIGINHLKGHIFANWIESKPKLPAMVLTVSGGHTSLIHMKKIDDFGVIGETRDDAAGEAFDKVAKILGLGYPGGPAIEAMASKIKNLRCFFDASPTQGRSSDKIVEEVGVRTPDVSSGRRTKIKNKGENPIQIKFPRPMLNQDDFSFSGLKTAVLYKTMKLKLDDNLKSQIAYEFQKAVVETLVEKTLKAAQKHKVKSILLSGGVAANKFLRSELKKRARGEGFKFYVPSFEYCTDNAAMIGMAAYIKSLKIKPTKWYDINADANPTIKEKD